MYATVLIGLECHPVGWHTRIHGPLIWAWARKFTDSTNAAEAVTRDILSDISISAKGFDAAKCSEITYVKQICIRRLTGVAG